MAHRFAGHRAGMALAYLTITIGVLCGFVAFAVDVGRVQVARNQAQAAADAAALYAAGGIIGGTPTAVRTRAVTAAADNYVDSTRVSINSTTDVTLGIWDPTTHTFFPLTGAAESGATAVKVTVVRAKSRGNAYPLLFAGVIGVKSIDVGATAIASISSVRSATVPGCASPWLAGASSGTSIAPTGGNTTAAVAPANSPIFFPTKQDAAVRFTSTNGTTSWNSMNHSGTDTASADGDDTYIAAQDPVNGLNTTYAPLDAMMGVFLDDSSPTSTAMAASLDFSTPTSRDFTTLSPGLKQVFFIGDGLNSAGQLQTFIAPHGATRLYIGTMDEKGWWWDNTGSLNFIAVTGNAPVLVK